ncbi:MAG: VTT domain-containing protein [Clostridia bacterium]|nr:VTT domain-containing protein [Clostridia bacterium]
MSTQHIAEFFETLGVLAVPASIVLSIMIAVIGVLPSLFVTSANVILFGPYYGFFISWTGEVIGAWVSFYLYRLGFKSRIEKLGKDHALIGRITSSHGKKTGLLIFQARLIPYVPSGFVTLAAAISNVSLSLFLLSSSLGKLPSIALEALVSNHIISLNPNWVRLLLTLTSLTLIIFIIKGNIRR